MRNYENQTLSPSDFFRVTQKVRSDISFKTLVGQYEEMERTRSFYEQKCFRLMNNNYIKLMELGEFDLSSMIAEKLKSVKPPSNVRKKKSRSLSFDSILFSDGDQTCFEEQRAEKYLQPCLLLRSIHFHLVEHRKSTGQNVLCTSACMGLRSRGSLPEFLPSISTWLLLPVK